jgi:hypothetical protein
LRRSDSEVLNIREGESEERSLRVVVCRIEETAYFQDTLTDGVPKVPKAPETPFFHFWHCLTLGTSNELESGEARWNKEYIRESFRRILLHMSPKVQNNLSSASVRGLLTEDDDRGIGDNEWSSPHQARED